MKGMHFVRLLATAAVLAFFAVFLWAAPVMAQAETPPPPEPGTEEQLPPAVEEEQSPDPDGGLPPANEQPPTGTADEVDQPTAAAPEPPQAETETPPPVVSATPEAASATPASSSETPTSTEEPAAPPETPGAEPGQDPAETESVVETAVDTLAEAGVTLVGEDGEPLSMASNEAEEALTDPGSVPVDPWFVYKGVTYRFLPPAGDCSPYPANTCFVMDNPLQGAIDYIGTQKIVPTDKAIHLDPGTLTLNSDVTINGSNAYVAKLTMLVGAGSSNNPNTPTTETQSTISFGNDYRLYILNMPGPFTLKGFNVTGNIITKDGNVTGLVEITNNNGAMSLTDIDVKNSGGIGVQIRNQKSAVTLRDVESSENFMTGISIDNTLGTAAVSIINGEFDHNENGSGLAIKSRGTITLDGVTASANGNTDPGSPYKYSGADLSFGSLVVKNSFFSDNTIHGLSTPDNVWVKGNVTLDNVTTDENAQNGVNLLTQGDIKINNLHAHHNGQSALNLDTCNYNGSTCAAYGKGNITVQNSDFESNQFGTYIKAKGTIVLNSVNSSSHTGAEANQLDNTQFATGSPGITLTNVTFNSNNSNGGYIRSKGSITVSGGHFDGNTKNGLVLDNCLLKDNICLGTGSITVSGTSSNRVSMNGNGDFDPVSDGAGLIALSSRNITINYAEFNENVAGATCWSIVDPTHPEYSTCGYGAYLNTNLGPVTKYVGNVTVNNSVFEKNTHTGLQVESRGTITLNGVIARYNSHNEGSEIYGAYLTNTTVAGKQVTVTKSTFDNNLTSGLYIYTRGAIVLSYLNASNNANGGMGHTAMDDYSAVDYAGLGIYANNKQPGVSSGITLTGSSSTQNTFVANLISALLFTSNGMITVERVEAREQGSTTERHYAVRIDTPSDVKFNYSSISSNFGGGLSILTGRNISMTGNSFTYNEGGAGAILGLLDIDEYGVVLTDSALTGSVTISNTRFTGNGYLGYNSHKQGLHVYNKGTIYLTNVTAISNFGDGLHLNNTPSTTKSSVTITSTKGQSNYVMDNRIYGIYILTDGPATVANLTVDKSQDTNLYIEQPEGAYGTVKLEKVTSTSSQSNHGVEISARSPVTIYSLVASNNSAGYGLKVNVIFTTTLYSVSLSNVVLDSNETGGEIKTNGNITLSSVTVENTLSADKPALLVDNSAGTGSITISGSKTAISQFEHNKSSGLEIKTRGSVSMSYTSFSHNTGGGGAVIDNTQGTGSVTINSSSFNGNSNAGSGWGGLTIRTKGAITLNSVQANDNKSTDASLFGYGAVLDNCLKPIDGATCSVNNPVSISNSSFNGNGRHGLQVVSGGTLYLRNVSSQDNKGQTSTEGFGISLDNSMSTSAPGVTLLNDNTSYRIYNNDTYGLKILTKGPVAFTRVTVSENGPIDEEGVSTENNTCLSTGMGGSFGACVYNAGGSGEVSINSSSFAENNGFGLWVVTAGKITLSSVNAMNNKGDGARLDNKASPLIVTKSSSYYNTVTVYRSKFDGNTATKTEDLEEQAGYLGDGLKIDTKGKVIFNNVTANNNGGANYGASVTNSDGDKSGVQILTTYGANSFSNNMGTGLTINTIGQIQLERVTASRNLLNGAQLTNTGGYDVIINNSVFSSNGDLLPEEAEDHLTSDGLVVTTKGHITVYNIDANGNTQNGAILIISPEATSARTVSVKRSRFNLNADGVGLTVTANGAITLDTVSASQNRGADLTTGFGIVLDNTSSSSAGVTINRSYGGNVFNNNYHGGLLVKTNGGATMYSLTANDNGGNGVTVMAKGVVSVNTLSTYRNNHHGFSATTQNNTITVDKAFSIANGWDGIHMETTGGKLCTVKNSTINGNMQNGVYMKNGANGKLSLANTSYYGNVRGGNSSFRNALIEIVME